MKRAIFGHKALPWLFLAPQLLVTIVFFLWPAGQAVRQSFLQEDAFGFKSTFVGLKNYTRLFHDPSYLNSIQVTLVFTVTVAAVSILLGLILALAVDRVLKGGTAYTTLLVWPYAVAPAVAGIMWWFIFNPTIGIIPYVLETMGYDWNHGLDGTDAMILVVIAAAWKQISYNFLFFRRGPAVDPGNSLREAAAIDGAGPVKRFFTITLPLLSPTTFFLMVVNIVYAMFETFQRDPRDDARAVRTRRPTSSSTRSSTTASSG